MALVFAQSGAAMQREPDGMPTQFPHPGNSVVGAVGAASVNVALPVDANGKAYQAVRISVSTPTWCVFCTAGGDAASAAAPCFIVTAGAGSDYAIPPATPGGANATNLAFIQVAAGGAISITGLF